MDPTAVATGAFLVVGLRTRTTNRIEAVPETAKIGSLWREFYAERVPDRIPDRLAESPEVVAVYFDYESDHRGQYSLLVGHKVSSFDRVPTQMGRAMVRGGRYLRFPVEGAMPAAIIQTWQAIWQFFEVSHEYERAYTTDYEIYRDNGAEIYIGVK